MGNGEQLANAAIRTSREITFYYLQGIGGAESVLLYVSSGFSYFLSISLWPFSIMQCEEMRHLGM